MIKLLRLIRLLRSIFLINMYKLIYNIHTTGIQVFGRGFGIYAEDEDINIFLGNIRVRDNFKIQIGKGAVVIINDGVFFNNNCSINSLGKVEIGKNSIFGENVKIYDHNHKFKESKLIKEQGYSIKNVQIGENCWIGSNVTILHGVTIGDNVVIGANCLIYKSIESNKLIIHKQNQIEEKISL
jgi:acetyltransferase-like isoleucine patch superfamily enzyme